MAIRLVQGTIETINATVTDTSDTLTTLDGSSPTYTVVPVDPDTDVDVVGSDLYTDEPALNSGMMIQALIDTTTGGTGTDAPLWDRGKYRIYVGFTNGSEVPKLGPADLYII